MRKSSKTTLVNTLVIHLLIPYHQLVPKIFSEYLIFMLKTYTCQYQQQKKNKNLVKNLHQIICCIIISSLKFAQKGKNITKDTMQRMKIKLRQTKIVIYGKTSFVYHTLLLLLLSLSDNNEVFFLYLHFFVFTFLCIY